MIVVKVALLSSKGSHGCPLTEVVLFVPILFLVLPTSSAQRESRGPAPVAQPPSPWGTVLLFLMSMLIFLIVGCLSLYIRERISRRRGDGPPVRAEPRLPRPRRGLEKEVIESLPTFSYSTVKEHRIDKCALECAVCLNEFEDHETLRLIPTCSHVFHPECIDKWLTERNTCPVCRIVLAAKPAETASVQPQETVAADGENGSSERWFLDSPDTNLINSAMSANRNRNPRSRSMGWATWDITELLPRSISTGRPLVQPAENVERFTLTLPEEERSRLVKSISDQGAARAQTAKVPNKSLSIGSVYYCEGSGPKDADRPNQHRRAFSLNYTGWIGSPSNCGS